MTKTDYSHKINLGKICEKYGLELRKNDRKIFMNILVIGNGFDLAHGLLTKYGELVCETLKRNYWQAQKGEYYVFGK